MFANLLVIRRWITSETIYVHTGFLAHETFRYSEVFPLKARSLSFLSTKYWSASIAMPLMNKRNGYLYIDLLWLRASKSYTQTSKSAVGGYVARRFP